MVRLSLLLCFLLTLVQVLDAFAPPTLKRAAVPRSMGALDAAKKKRKRRRKKPLVDPSDKEATLEATDPVTARVETVQAEADTSPNTENIKAEMSTSSEAENTAQAVTKPQTAESASKPKTDAMPKSLQDVVNFKFDPDAKKTYDVDDVMDFKDESAAAEKDILQEAAALPDMKELKKTKELEQALAQLQEEKEAAKPKIKRSDTKAFVKLLETNPYIDADDSFFEEEEYGTIEALLGERAKPFLGIPTGPLQVGHFVGALVIALMGFVEYPGFPLTNLPTPLRNCFQGGLAAIYAINAVLAILAVFKATERGQSPVLWGIKTFSVGGLALDQLTQLPTLEQKKKAESQQGARALKNKKR